MKNVKNKCNKIYFEIFRKKQLQIRKELLRLEVKLISKILYHFTTMNDK